MTDLAASDAGGDAGSGPAEKGSSDEGGTSVGEVQQSDTTPSTFKMTNTVYNHFIEDFIGSTKESKVSEGVIRLFGWESARPYVDSPGTKMLIEEIMQGVARPDPGGYPNALRWDEPGSFNTSEGVWQLVVDTETHTVLHFNFVSK